MEHKNKQNQQAGLCQTNNNQKLLSKCLLLTKRYLGVCSDFSVYSDYGFCLFVYVLIRFIYMTAGHVYVCIMYV